MLYYLRTDLLTHFILQINLSVIQLGAFYQLSSFCQYYIFSTTNKLKKNTKELILQIFSHNLLINYLLSLCSLDVAWFGHLFTGSWTCSGFMNIGIARITHPCGGCLKHLNRIGQVVAILTYNFLSDSEYWK